MSTTVIVNPRSNPESAGLGEQRVTIPPMYKAIGLALLVVAVLVLAARPWDTGSDRDQVGALEEETRRLSDEVEALEERVTELAAELSERSEAERTLGGRVASLRRRLDRALTRLREDMADLQTMTEEARSVAGTAGDRASSALDRAQGVAEDLRVLEDRFNVHMRRNHGG